MGHRGQLNEGRKGNVNWRKSVSHFDFLGMDFFFGNVAFIFVGGIADHSVRISSTIPYLVVSLVVEHQEEISRDDRKVEMMGSCTVWKALHLCDVWRSWF